MKNGTAEDALRENKVMVADDDFFMRGLVKKALEGIANVTEAESGDQVVELYKANRPDVLLLDIHLPKENGKVILQKILKIDPKAYVVMLTADGVARNVHESSGAGARGFVVKPFTKETLLKHITACPTFHLIG